MPPPAQTMAPSRREPISLFGLFLLGILGVVVGLLLVALSDSGTADAVGWIIAGVGGVVLQVGVIAAGVEIALRRVRES